MSELPGKHPLTSVERPTPSDNKKQEFGSKHFFQEKNGKNM